MTFKRGYDPNRTWKTWLVQRLRNLALIAGLLILLAVLQIFGQAKP
jgi:hypothetical protein